MHRSEAVASGLVFLPQKITSLARSGNGHVLNLEEAAKTPSPIVSRFGNSFSLGKALEGIGGEDFNTLFV